MCFSNWSTSIEKSRIIVFKVWYFESEVDHYGTTLWSIRPRLTWMDRWCSCGHLPEHVGWYEPNTQLAHIRWSRGCYLDWKHEHGKFPLFLYGKPLMSRGFLILRGGGCWKVRWFKMQVISSKMTYIGDDLKISSMCV